MENTRRVSYTFLVATPAVVEHRLNELQQALIDLARQNDKTSRSIDRLSDEMREFKTEVREFKDETRKANAELRTALAMTDADMRTALAMTDAGMRTALAMTDADMHTALAKNDADMRTALAKTDADMHAALAKNDADMRAALAKNDVDMRAAMNRQSAELSRTLGRLAEDIVGPSIPSIFKRFFPGRRPEFAMRISKLHKVSGLEREFDTPAWNDAIFLVCETKSRLRPEDLASLSNTIAEIRDFFPEANGKKVCAALASLYIDSSLVTAGEKRGFIMIALGNNLAEVMNSEGFKPAEF